MLAQSFKSATELNISEAEKDALIKTLVLLETGKLAHKSMLEQRFLNRETKIYSFSGEFNMSRWHVAHECGTVACIGGTAELIGNVVFNEDEPGLHKLFYPEDELSYDAITPEHAAKALRSYLTTGDPHWDLAITS